MIWLVDILSEMTEILWGLFRALLKSIFLEEKRLFRSCFFHSHKIQQDADIDW